LQNGIRKCWLKLRDDAHEGYGDQGPNVAFAADALMRAAETRR
jgi:hypothetical protein